MASNASQLFYVEVNQNKPTIQYFSVIYEKLKYLKNDYLNGI